MELTWIDALTNDVTAAFVTRRGIKADDDVSTPYAGFNACHYTGDEPERVAASRRQLAEKLGVNVADLVIPTQTHSCRVELIHSAAEGGEPGRLEGVDGVVTDAVGVVVCVNTADCVPLVMADAEAGVVAAVHAGWRGVVGGIAQCAVEVMVGAGAAKENIKVAMGPCICSRCFEVGEEVAEQFERHFGTDVVERRRGEKPHVDLIAALRVSLADAGVVSHNVAERAVACSRCESENYFSARRLGVKSGRTLTGIFRR